jgi:predicted AAA+ superfamily ATPase
MDRFILRPLYVEQIKTFIDKPFIKIITGIRRSGKSELLKMLKSEVLKNTDHEHIIFINFEDEQFANITTNKELSAYFKSRMTDDKPYYIFLDEIQEVNGWEKSVNSARLKGADIYITGSNSKIMSEELATLLGGRTLSFSIHPLSFAEFIEFRKQNGLLKDSDDAALLSELDEYIRIGGFPVLALFNYPADAARKIVQDINSTALLRDVSVRHKIRMPQLLDKIVAFIYDNVGNLVSIASITKYLKSQNRGSDPETIANYLKYLEDACIIRRAQRYDIKGKKLLETVDKYYLGDHSLQYAIRNYRENNLQGVLENIIYLELVRRGYTVHVGKALGDKKIDFIAEKGASKIYVQACVDFSAAETMKREFEPLKNIRDNYPKYVVTLGKYWRVDDEGVKGIHLKDFLLKNE